MTESHKTKRLRIALIILAVIVVGPCLLFIAASSYVNSVGLPPPKFKPVEVDSMGPIRVSQPPRPNVQEKDTVLPAAKVQFPVFCEAQKEYVAKQQSAAPESGPGADYTRLLRRFKKEKPDEDFRKAFPDTVRKQTWNGMITTHSLAWHGGEINAAQAKYLRDHAAWIDEIRRLAETDGPAPMNREEVDGVTFVGEDREFGYFISIRHALFAHIQPVLIADGCLKMQERHYEDALRDGMDVYRLMAKEYDQYDIMMGMPEFADAEIRHWIEETPGLSGHTAEFAAFLDDYHRRRLSSPKTGNYIEKMRLQYYEQMRNQLAWGFAHSPRMMNWKSNYYGYDLNDTAASYRYWTPIGTSGMMIPRLDKMLLTSIDAMSRRATAPRLHMQDLQMQEEGTRGVTTMSWKEMHVLITSKKIEAFTFPLNLVDLAVRRETNMNLNRAALAWMKDNASAEAARKADLTKDYENPWRDPYSEKAFLTNGTLIYSVGPDLADQRGLVTYDPTNGALSAGDLVIRVPR